MADSIPVTLRPDPHVDPSAESISSILGRLTVERGFGWLKDTTESSVLDAIVAANADPLSTSDSDDEDDAQPVQTSWEARRAYLFTKGSELRTLGTEAWNETNRIANASSILLSKYSGRAAVEPSMLAEDRVQLGRAFDTMGFDLVSVAGEKDRNEKRPAEEKAQDAAAKERNEEIAMGWKIDVLDRTAKKVSAAAKRLNDEMEKERKYWAGVIGLQEDGWSLTRTRERGALGVRYGFSEGRGGTAALKVADDGNLKLDTGIERKPRSVRLRIVQGEEVECSSVVPCAAPDDASLEVVIKQARDTLFEEELFQELVREAPTLMGAGVKHVDQSITAPLEDEGSPTPAQQSRTLVIDLIPLPTSTLPLGDKKSAANIIALALRILLSHLHNTRHAKRTRPPIPLPKMSAKEKDKPKLPPVNNLLRTILSIYAQNTAVTTVLSYLRPVFTALSSAGLHASIKLETQDRSASGSATSTSTAASLISSLTGSTPGSIILSLPNEVIKIRVETEAVPLIGTIFTVVHSPPALDDTEMTDADEDTADAGETENEGRQRGREGEGEEASNPTSPPRRFTHPLQLLDHLLEAICLSILDHLLSASSSLAPASSSPTAQGKWYITDDPPRLESSALESAAKLRAVLLKEEEELKQQRKHGQESHVNHSFENEEKQQQHESALSITQRLLKHVPSETEAEAEAEQSRVINLRSVRASVVVHAGNGDGDLSTHAHTSKQATIYLNWGRASECARPLAQWPGETKSAASIFSHFARGI